MQLIFLGKVTTLGVLYCFSFFVCLTLLASFFIYVTVILREYNHELHLFLPFLLPPPLAAISPITQEQPWVPSLVSTLSQCLPAWRREHADLPALTWSNFHSKTRDLVNPLVSEERMKVVAAALHSMGEVRREREREKEREEMGEGGGERGGGGGGGG